MHTITTFINGQNWVDEHGNELSSKRYEHVGYFSDNFAFFTDDLGSNWVNEQGKELSNKRYNNVWMFINGFGLFEDNGVFGFVNYLGIEFRDKNFEFTKFKDDNFYSFLADTIVLELKLLDNFPKDSLKRFVFEEII